MPTLLRQLGIYSDKWTNLVARIEVPGPGPISLTFFLPRLQEGVAKTVVCSLGDRSYSVVVNRGELNLLEMDSTNEGPYIVTLTADEPEPWTPHDQRVLGVLVASIKHGGEEAVFDFENMLPIENQSYAGFSSKATTQSTEEHGALNPDFIEIARIPAPPRKTDVRVENGFGIIEAPSDLLVMDARNHDPSTAIVDRTFLLCDGSRVLSAKEPKSLTSRLDRLRTFVKMSGHDPAVKLRLEAAAREKMELGNYGVPDPADLSDSGDCALTSAIRDIWYGSQTSLTVSFSELDLLFGGRAARIRAFQFSPGPTSTFHCLTDVEIGRSGLDFVELELVCHWKPVLLELRDPADFTVGLAAILFPSLARGGLHHSEFVTGFVGAFGLQPMLSYMEDLARAAARQRSSVEFAVRLDGATGGEAIFQPSLRDWIQGFGHSVTAVLSGDAEDADILASTGLPPSRESGRTLMLPADAIPTLSAVCGVAFDEADEGAGVRVPSPFLLAEVGTGRPRWSIALPADPLLVHWQDHIGQWDYPVASGMGKPSTPVAVRMPVEAGADRPLSHLCSSPLPPVVTKAQAERTFCVLEVDEISQTRRCLVALNTQDRADALRVLLSVPPRLAAHQPAFQALLQETGVLDGEVRVMIPGSPPIDWLLSASEGFSSILLLRDGVILHDPQTLAVLQHFLSEAGTASVAPMILQEETVHKSIRISHAESGYFPSRVHFSAGPRLVVATSPGVLEALPVSVFPVIANTQSAVLIGREAVSGSHLHLLEPAAFGLEATARGYRNVCVAALRATSVRRLPAQEVMDPAGTRLIDPSAWGGLLSGVARIEEIR
ncbi:hypothetical protein [Roseicyclus persicicus]|uniref:Uncharacterized protein n=1 Tax=Roseicyclus persicicus TaxID=2650661 RepID=A0A7X6JZB3_9RHOB|nr:hypothetical protein [Roseibacterium persicicum]NKX45344.1 hypothetical protein [Roseibacterium persicicum]